MAIGLGPAEMAEVIRRHPIESLVRDVKQINKLSKANVVELVARLVQAAHQSSDHSLFFRLLHPIRTLNALVGVDYGSAMVACLEAVLTQTFAKKEYVELLGRAGLQDFVAKDMTFRHLRELVAATESGTAPFKFLHLHVVACRISPTTGLVVFSSEDEKFSNVRLVDAVRASMSIPGVFQPHRFRYRSGRMDYEQPGDTWTAASCGTTRSSCLTTSTPATPAALAAPRAAGHQAPQSGTIGFNF